MQRVRGMFFAKLPNPFTRLYFLFSPRFSLKCLSLLSPSSQTTYFILGEKTTSFKRKPTVRVPSLLKKIDKMTKKENPPSQRTIAKLCGTSDHTIRRVISVDLKKIIRRKTKVHVLKKRHIKNRITTARKLYKKYLAGEKCKFTLTLDEGWFYLANCNGKHRICYCKKGDNVPSNWVVEGSESYGDKFMVVGAICGKGVLSLHRVPPNVKLNSKYYIYEVSKQLLEDEVQKRYGEEANKVVVHHDQASSHTSRETAAYAANLKDRLGISIMDNSDIPVKSPDLSPMDFFGFGYLKQQLFKRKATTLNGVWKAMQEEWNKITPLMVRNVMNSWKRRCRLIRVTNGRHVEPIAKIHRRKIKL
jgi:histone-lysine N-methyltransferase SETMAR